MFVLLYGLYHFPYYDHKLKAALCPQGIFWLAHLPMCYLER